MSSYGRSKRVKREKWANRMAVLGVTMVVLCLAVAAKGEAAGRTGTGRRRTDEKAGRVQGICKDKAVCRRSCKGETGSGKSG